MPSPTLFTDINLTTSAAGFFASKLTAAGWAVYWQARDIFSGTAIAGEVTLVPEFPNEPQFIVLPPRPRTSSEVIVPAFSVHITSEPVEEERAGLGEDLFQQRASITIDGFVADQAQHLVFATLMRNWFREDTTIPIYDFEANPNTPSLIDDRNNRVTNRQVIRIEKDLPDPVRYYINCTCDLIYYD